MKSENTAHKIANPNKSDSFSAKWVPEKTTFIKQLAKFGCTEATSSPTFSLVNEYQTNDNQIVYHFDFYRLKMKPKR
jgi:tRNA threonylcarbamoyladenosine biosynthesis protein TsaE